MSLPALLDGVTLPSDVEAAIVDLRARKAAGVEAGRVRGSRRSMRSVSRAWIGRARICRTLRRRSIGRCGRRRRSSSTHRCLGWRGQVQTDHPSRARSGRARGDVGHARG